jgi:hypothetical protein
MTLAEVLKHIFSDEDLNKEVVNYTVTHDLSCSEFTVLLEDSTILKVHKIGD